MQFAQKQEKDRDGSSARQGRNAGPMVLADDDDGDPGDEFLTRTAYSHQLYSIEAKLHKEGREDVKTAAVSG